MPHLSPSAERRLLQMVIALGGFVPVVAGLAGAILGPGLAGGIGASASLDSHERYLSSLLLGIGLAFWEAIPRIERYTDRVRLLTTLIVFAGLLQLATLLVIAVRDGATLFGVVMALVVAPLICIWQGRVARRFATTERVGQS